MAYHLGVDIGTTYTAAATWSDGRVEVAGLGSRSAVMPTIVCVMEGGHLVVGEAAERRGRAEPERVTREFKRRLGDPTPLIVGGSPLSADLLVARVLRAVVDQVTEREGGGPAGLVVTHPANWGDYKRELLAQALRAVDVDGTTLVTEPEAAAVHYTSQARVEPGAAIAVYDLGGGTFDAAVLRKTPDGWTLLGPPQGIERLGGIDFDEAVFRHVVASLGEDAIDLDPDDPVAAAAMARLRQDCVDAKEALSFDTHASVPVFLPRAHRDVRLTRREFEDMVRPMLAQSVDTLERALRVADVAPDDLAAVLLVGGSSRIPLVAQLVGAAVGRPVAVDAHPKHGTALGAAILAATAPTTADPTPSPRAPTAADPTPTATPTPPTPADPTPAASGPPGPAPAPVPDVPEERPAEPTLLVPVETAPLAFAGPREREAPVGAPPEAGAAVAFPTEPPAKRRRRALVVVALAVVALLALAATQLLPGSPNDDETDAGDEPAATPSSVRGQAIASLPGHSDWVRSVAFSPDGALVASGSFDNTVRLWGAASRNEVAVLQHPAEISSVAFSPDGSLLATGSWDGAVRLWDPESHTELAALTGHDASVRSVALSTDRTLLASGADDGTVRLWDPESRTELATLTGHTEGVWSTAFAPDGRVLASGADDGTVRLWDARSETLLGTLTGHEQGVLSVAFSPDGSLLASGSWDGTVRLWEPSSQEEVATLRGHGDEVMSVAFSPDGSLLATAAADGTVRLWDPTSRTELTILDDPARAVWSVAFSPDGSLLATAAEDVTVRLWQLDVDR